MTESEGAVLARLEQAVKGIAEDVTETKGTVTTIAAEQGAAAVEVGRLQERGKVANARIDNLERNQRWVILAVAGAILETALRQLGVLG